MTNLLSIEQDIVDAEIMLEKCVGALEFMDVYGKLKCDDIRQADASAARGTADVIAASLGVTTNEIQWQTNPALDGVGGESLWKSAKSAAAKVYRVLADAMIAARKAVSALIRAILTKLGIVDGNKLSGQQAEVKVEEHKEAVKQTGAQVGERITPEVKEAAKVISEDIFIGKDGTVASEQVLRGKIYTLSGRKRLADDVADALNQLCTAKDGSDIEEKMEKWCGGLEAIVGCYSLPHVETILSLFKNIKSPEDVKAIADRVPGLLDEIEKHFITQGNLKENRNHKGAGDALTVQVAKGMGYGILTNRKGGFAKIKTMSFGGTRPAKTIVGIPNIGLDTIKVFDTIEARIHGIISSFEAINEEAKRYEEELTANKGKSMQLVIEAIDYHLPAGTLDDPRREQALALAKWFFHGGLSGLYASSRNCTSIANMYLRHIGVVRADISGVLRKAKVRGDKRKEK